VLEIVCSVLEVACTVLEAINGTGIA